MIFRSRTPNRSLFGLEDSPPEWRLPESGDGKIETMILGPERSRNKWASMGAPVVFSRWRLGLFGLLTIFGLLVGRSAFLQVVQGGYYRDIADANKTRVEVIPSHRGILKDRNGIELAENVPSFRLLVWPKDLPEDEGARTALVHSVAVALQQSERSLTERLAEVAPDEADEQLLLSEDIAYDDALGFMATAEKYPGFSVEFAERRHYFTGAIPTLSHVLGYTGPVNTEEYETLADKGYRRFDSVGKQGLEAWHEDVLRGQFGAEVVEVNAQGQALRLVSRREAIDGEDLTLTIDSRLQAYIEIVLEERLKAAPTQKASVIAMDPQNGELLALVSSPGFDANAFASGISTEAYAALLNDPNIPLFPRAHAGEYPSGSVIKPVFAAAALTNGLVTPQTTFVSTGGVMLGNRFFPDWRPGGHGITNVYHAIADSVNTFFYMIGGGNESFPGMGLEKLMTAALTFGYGQKSGVDLPGEADGFLPSKAWKEEAKGEPWYIGDTYNVSIGQGDFLTTPLQVARATAVFANGGQLVTPHLVIGDSQEAQAILSSEVTQIVKDAMRQTVTNGSARSMQTVPVPVAGKTGTAQWSQSKDPHSWFTGFAPFDNPEIVITVLVEEGGELSHAIPVAHDILTWYFANQE
jgi:penicillin-binding protein 2